MIPLRLTLDRLALERSGMRLFSDLSCRVEGGTLLRVSGSNGAGKTSLLRVLAGLSSAVEGSVQWHRDSVCLPPTEAALLVGHSVSCNDALTVAENIEYTAAIAGLNAGTSHVQHALTALDAFALRDRRFGSLSQGQKKRVSLARLLLSTEIGARAWLLDEPFVALDVATQQRLLALMSIELQAGGLVVLISHQEVEINAATTQEIRL